MTLATSLALTLLAAVCSSSAPRLAPLALLLLADRCEAAGTICNNNAPCSFGCPTGVYGTSLCDGNFMGTWVDLHNQGLSGTIPPQLGDNSQLVELYLWNNSISGTIPPETGKLSQLWQFDLYNNSISGTIPPETGKLSQLGVLALRKNSISGTIPAETSKLSQLGVLSLSNNDISGTIPPETGKLSQLYMLYLYNNSISGTIPAETSMLYNLTLLKLYNNLISGSVPSQLNSLPLTYSCGLGGTNHFACPLPALPDACTSGSEYPPECNYPPTPPPSPPPTPPPSPPPPGEECGEWWKVLLSVLMTALGSLGTFGGLAYLRYLKVLKSLVGPDGMPRSATWRGFWDFLKTPSYVEVAQDACKSVTSEVGSVESVGDSVREMLPKGEELMDKMEEGMKKAAKPTKEEEQEEEEEEVKEKKAAGTVKHMHSCPRRKSGTGTVSDVTWNVRTHPELYEHTVDTEEVSRLSKSGYLRGKDKALQMAKEHGGTRGQQYAAAAFEKAEGAASDAKEDAKANVVSVAKGYLAQFVPGF